jgi:type II secretory pathway component GspD/PulD (secretin)
VAALRSHLVLIAVLGSLAGGTAVRADPPVPGAAPPAPVPAPVPAPGAPGTPPPGAPVPAEAPRAVLKFENDALIERANGKVVYFYRTNFVQAGDLVTSAASMDLKGLGVSLTPFPAQNQVLLEGDPEAVVIVRDALAYFDVSTPQVFLEAKVVEITSDCNFEYGLDYGLDRNISGSDTFWRGISGFLAPPAFIGSTLPGALPFQGTNLLFGLIPGPNGSGSNTAMKFGAFELALRALQENGKAEILSRPSIICTQGVPAEVVTSEEFSENRLDTASRQSTLAGAVADLTQPPPVVQQNVLEIENYRAQPARTGVELRVTAKHIGESFVTIDIFPKVMGLAGSGTRLGGTSAQIVTTRSAKTTVTMADGETLVIGGLYTNRLVKGEARTPLLSDLPLVGTLFTRQHETKQKTELIFILTPRIIRKNADARMILPPAELERLEADSDGHSPCGPCKPVLNMEDVLYPGEAGCRRQKECQARAAAQAEAAKSSSKSAAAPTASSRPPPPPPSPPALPVSASPAPVRTR